MDHGDIAKEGSMVSQAHRPRVDGDLVWIGACTFHNHKLCNPRPVLASGIRGTTAKGG